MKKKIKYVLILMVIFLTFGCMDYKTNMSISKDKSVDFKVNATINMLKYFQIYSNYLSQICTSTCENDQECLNECNGNQIPTDEEALKEYINQNVKEEDFKDMIDDESIKEYKDKGYDVTSTYDSTNYQYVISMTKKFANIDQITRTDDSPIDFSDLIANEVFFSKKDNVYRANYIINTDEASDNLDIDIDINSEEVKQNMTMTYEVKLPVKPISHNASTTSRDGKTLTWDLLKKERIQFEFAFEEENQTNNTILEDKKFNIFENKYFAFGLIGAGVILLIIGIIGLSKALKLKK